MLQQRAIRPDSAEPRHLPGLPRKKKTLKAIVTATALHVQSRVRSLNACNCCVSKPCSPCAHDPDGAVHTAGWELCRLLRRLYGARGSLGCCTRGNGHLRPASERERCRLKVSSSSVPSHRHTVSKQAQHRSTADL